MMNKLQEQEWLEAQKISISMDLVAAAQRQLQFLATVDRNRCLYDGPILQRALYRYKTCWLPLLAQHSSSDLGGDLVVPLDCEWIWHCHRLNPVQYNLDCQQFYGRILDSKNVASVVVEGTTSKATEEIWSEMFPHEPYELDLNNTSTIICSEAGGITYDLVDAVRRQKSFYYQVARDHMNDSRYLEESVGRYKGFLHQIKRNKEKSLGMFCVPTYDIDLIWHSHQLQPASYSQDMTKVMGRILEHDDTGSDGGKGNKRENGFTETTRQWEETFGLRYWRAGAMYKGSEPTLAPIHPFPIKSFKKSFIVHNGNEDKLQLRKTNTVEICLEIVGVRNIPSGLEGLLFISISKSQPDQFFNREKRLAISSGSRQKNVALFQCETLGELNITLMSNSTFFKKNRPVGTLSIPLDEYTRPNSDLAVEKWFNLRTPFSSETGAVPASLLVAISFTIPTQAPYKLSFFPLLRSVQPLDKLICVKDQHGNEIINIQIRIVEKVNEDQRTDIVGIFDKSSDETRILAEWNGIDQWAITNSQWLLQLDKNSQEYIVDLRVTQPVKIYHGRRLEFECFNSLKTESDFLTLVGFSKENPYGKALALIDLKSNHLKVNEKCYALPAIILSYLLSNIYNKDGCNKNSVNHIAMESEVDATDHHVKRCGNSRRRMCDVNNIMEMEGGSCSGGSGGGRCGSCGAGDVGMNGGRGAGSCGSGCGGSCGGGRCHTV